MTKDGMLQFVKQKRKLIAVGIGILGILLLFLSEMIGTTAEKKQTGTVAADTASAAADRLEKKLVSLISAVDGAGKTVVMVTLDSAGEEFYAEDAEVRSETGERTTEYTEERKYVLIDSGGLKLKTAEPQIRGVAVVCEGGGSSTVKREITEIVRAALGISRDKIYVAEMNQTNGGRK
ncbi:MAG: stage III sporulation protein AG [Clostridia bacterium]|nr:stage III sporulation protein AG [Clostridia bacterium]